jgi:hypothetical protein
MSSNNNQERGSLRNHPKRQTVKRRLFADDNDDPIVDPKDGDMHVIEVKPQTTSVLETPEKKHRLDDGVRPFFSPKGKRFVTPEKDEDEDEIETPAKLTPANTKKTKRDDDDDSDAVVYVPTYKLTPANSNKKKRKHDDSDGDVVYVPTYIHKNLGYQRKGQASLSEKLQKTFALVEEHFAIPDDFEQNKFDYGPQSGTCFEERVVQAYNLSLLEPKDESSADVEICSHCVKMGHKKNECPVLI